jgi:hypothetical protein
MRRRNGLWQKDPAWLISGTIRLIHQQIPGQLSSSRLLYGFLGISSTALLTVLAPSFAGLSVDR